MEQVDDLQRLEEAVQKLMDALNNSGRDKAEMESLLLAKDQEISELKEQVKTLRDERELVHQRVSGLIDSIDQMQKQVAGPQQTDQEAAEMKGNTLF